MWWKTAAGTLCSVSCPLCSVLFTLELHCLSCGRNISSHQPNPLIVKAPNSATSMCDAGKKKKKFNSFSVFDLLKGSWAAAWKSFGDLLTRVELNSLRYGLVSMTHCESNRAPFGYWTGCVDCYRGGRALVKSDIRVTGLCEIPQHINSTGFVTY